MKKPIIFSMLLILFLPFTNCEKDFSPVKFEKFFSPDKLSQLSLNHVGNFWANDSIKHVSDYVTEDFNIDPDHLASIC